MLYKLIEYLISERFAYGDITIPDSAIEQKMLFRSLVNVRPPLPISEDFLSIQDEYLQEESYRRGVVEVDELDEIKPNMYLWQGDITRLKVDAIANAANNKLLGCFIPCHGCIDNAIHTYSGVQLRIRCNEIMSAQGYDEPTGIAKITEAYNLPSKYILHTVGPIITGDVSAEDRKLLESCYRSCLEIALDNNLESIAFCCISTGEYRFPNDEAAEIAINTVRKFLAENDSNIKVIFDVFKEEDHEIYKRLLG